VPKGSRLSLPDYEWLKDLILSPEGKARIAQAAQLQPLADELGISMAQLAIAWCLKNPRVSTVILGASKVEQVQENLKALDAVELLDDAIMERIEGILGNKPPDPPSW
jgi:aryl-alcohol dehydrogenase-like predicted oxidoreductase